GQPTTWWRRGLRGSSTGRSHAPLRVGRERSPQARRWFRVWVLCPWFSLLAPVCRMVSGHGGGGRGECFAGHGLPIDDVFEVGECRLHRGLVGEDICPDEGAGDKQFAPVPVTSCFGIGLFEQ